MDLKVNKIKDEINRRIEECESKYPKDKGGYWTDEESDAFVIAEEYKKLLLFIDSLTSEKPSEGLEEAAEEYSGKVSHPLNNAFKAGAQWQKEQMMKNCLYNTEVMLRTKQNYTEYLTLAKDKLPHIPVSLGLNVGDKVKVIIVKEAPNDTTEKN